MPVLESKLDTRSEVFHQNLSDMRERLNQLQELYDEAAQGGGEEAIARLKSCLLYTSPSPRDRG